MTFEKFKNGKEPKQCDPGFKVQSIEGLCSGVRNL
jgi:hypothetical protein